MKHIVTMVSLMPLMFVVVAAVAQSSTPKPAPELKQWDVWVGNWMMLGKAKDSPTEPEYEVSWLMHGRRILGGFFVEVDRVLKRGGLEQRDLKILSYDPIKKIYIISGFSSDGTTWVSTATFDNETSLEHSTITAPDGKLTTCRNSWAFRKDRMAVSGISECEENGVRWVSFSVRGTKWR
jgi:hypothetical protein